MPVLMEKPCSLTRCWSSGFFQLSEMGVFTVVVVIVSQCPAGIKIQVIAKPGEHSELNVVISDGEPKSAQGRLGKKPGPP